MPKVVRTSLMLVLSMVSLVLSARADTVPNEHAPHEGVQVGMTIDQHNWQVAEQVLPPEILRPLQAGDFVIPVQATTDFPVRSAYQTATETSSRRRFAARCTIRTHPPMPRPLAARR